MIYWSLPIFLPPSYFFNLSFLSVVLNKPCHISINIFNFEYDPNEETRSVLLFPPVLEHLLSWSIRTQNFPSSKEILQRRKMCNIAIMQEPGPVVDKYELQRTMEHEGGFAYEDTALFLLLPESTFKKTSIRNKYKYVKTYNAPMYFVVNNERTTGSTHLYRLQHSPRFYERITDFSMLLENKSPSTIYNFEENKIHIIASKAKRSVCGRNENGLWDWRCPPIYLLVENFKKCLNFTPTYILSNSFMNDKTIYTGMTHLAETGQHRCAGFNASMLIWDKSVHHLLYCEDKVKPAKPAFLYWFLPFTLGVWILLAISFVLCIALSTAVNRDPVLTILSFMAFTIRQNPKQEINNILKIAYTLGTMFLTLFYESIVTTDLVAPPSPYVAKDFRELMVDKGFKLVHQYVPDIRKQDNSLYLRTYEKHNLSGEFFYKNLYLTRGNYTTGTVITVTPGHMNLQLIKYSLKTKGFCHILIKKRPFIERLYTISFIGYGHSRLFEFFSMLRDFGLLTTWGDWNEWIRTLDETNEAWKTQHNTSLFPSFQEKFVGSNDWKPLPLAGNVLQVFKMFLYSMGLAFIVSVLVDMMDRLSRRETYVVPFQFNSRCNSLVFDVR